MQSKEVEKAMDSEFQIRQFTEDDLDSVVEINRECLPENYPERFFLGLYKHAPKAFLIASRDGEVVGYIMCRIERGISNFGIRPTKKGHIVSVAVLPDHRRIGIGGALVDSAMKSMTSYGADEYFLEVRKTNDAAVSVYQNLGFSIKKTLNGYYRDGEDAYLMVNKKEEEE